MSRWYQKMNLYIWEIVSGDWVSVVKDIANTLFSDSPHRRWRWRWNRKKSAVTVTVTVKQKKNNGDGYGDGDKMDRFYGCRNRPRWRVTVSPWFFHSNSQAKTIDTVDEKKKLTKSFLLSFHEFLSVRAHIDRVSRWHIEVLLGTQKFRILTRKRNISTKR